MVWRSLSLQRKIITHGYFVRSDNYSTGWIFWPGIHFEQASKLTDSFFSGKG
ncbi:hypothetical protein [uncultured Methylophaga sp.]|uniref:hypothetical protein n=1 Tax=uncultured Methylophaga sp. TaxID=285271 RepID=UPI002606E4A2|nr:hypothetical protein [uncultured Methylophaga sp.]